MTEQGNAADKTPFTLSLGGDNKKRRNDPYFVKQVYDAAKAQPNSDQAISWLWQKGWLSYKLKPHQIPLYVALRKAEAELPREQFVLECSRRFGKTFILSLIAFENCLRQAHWRTSYMGPSQKLVNDVIKPAMLDLLVDCPESLRPKFKGMGNNYEFAHNGSQISIYGVNEGNQDSGRGATANELIVDEAGMIDRLEYALLDVFVPQLLTTKGHCKIASTPAITTDHDFFGIVEHAKQVTAHAMFNHQNTPGFPQEDIDDAIKTCRGADTNRYKREYLCQWLIAEERRIIPEWTADGNTVCEPEKDEFYEFYRKYVCMDLGFKNDFTAILFAYYDFPNARLVIEDEWTCKGHDSRTSEIARVVKDKEQELWPEQKVWLRISDNNESRTISDLNIDYDMSFTETDKDSLHAMVAKVNNWIADGRVVVNPKCKQLIGCLNSGVFNKARDKFDRSKVYGHYDALASLMYLVRNVERNEYTSPVPRNLGFNAYTQGYNGGRQRTEEQELADQLFPGLNDFLGHERRF